MQQRAMQQRAMQQRAMQQRWHHERDSIGHAETFNRTEGSNSLAKKLLLAGSFWTHHLATQADTFDAGNGPRLLTTSALDDLGSSRLHLHRGSEVCMSPNQGHRRFIHTTRLQKLRPFT
jgi:hypothetical protein